MVTLAIHTREYAKTLCDILAAHGVGAVIAAPEVADPRLPSAVKIQVDDDDLPLAIRIIESGTKSLLLEARRLAGMNRTVLIPVDFSDMSILAVKAGFELALRLQLKPLLLYACAVPIDDLSTPFAGLDDDQFGAPEMTDEAVESSEMMSEAKKLMSRFVKDVRRRQSDGRLPQVEFSSDVREGLAEEVILSFTRETPPALVVMACRDKNKRKSEMIGSVTAEVLDSCRVPVFTVPDNYALGSIRGVVRLAFFCNLDRQDLLSMQSLMRMFDYPEVDVWMIPVADRADSGRKLRQMAEFFAADFKTARFHPVLFSSGNFRPEFEKLVTEQRLQMMIVPNKKKNIISRLFNPGIAHKLLFERDMPMLALPI